MEQNALFSEIETHLLNDKKPSEYLNSLKGNETFEKAGPFVMLGRLSQVEQSPKYHPEGSVWNHTLMVVDLAAGYRRYSGDMRVFMWSALLHDVGKAVTTKMRKGRITSYYHETEGQRMATEFLRHFTDDERFINSVSMMVKWHMQALHFSKDGVKKSKNNMLSEVPLRDITLLNLCDRLGRGGMTEEKVKEEKENLKLFVTYLNKYTA